MKALITGASAGMGMEMARFLAKNGWDLILVARREERLKQLADSLAVDVRCIKADLSKIDECIRLHNEVADENIDMLINNAGFGICGNFDETSLERELEMIETNITAVHILTKLFLRDFTKRNSGYILNVASMAGFMPGPMMATYYATKNYVFRLTEAVYEELRRRGSKVSVSVLCPGPVDTEFNEVANVRFGLKGQDSKYVAEYAIMKTLEKKLIIIPSFTLRAAKTAQRFISEKLLCRIVYNIQKKKQM